MKWRVTIEQIVRRKAVVEVEASDDVTAGDKGEDYVHEHYGEVVWLMEDDAEYRLLNAEPAKGRKR